MKPLAPDRLIPAAFLNLALCFGAWAQGEGPSDNPRLLPANQPPGAWTLQWQGKPGRTYFLQNSHDLHTWTYLDTIHHGDGTKMEGVLSNAGKYFLRLRHTDIPCSDPESADFDNDGLGNAAELFWLCDPFLPDSDGDGFKDGWEVLAGWNPNQNNSANARLDSDGDGWDNAAEHERGTNPNQADSDTDGLPDPDDADPTDPTIDWPRAPEASRVWIPLTGYIPATHGAPVALANTGIALFEKAVWKNGVWKMLEWEKEGPTISYPDESFLVSTNLRAIRPIDLTDDGRVVGIGELIFDDPYGGDLGTPNTSAFAVHWSQQGENMAMEMTGGQASGGLDLETYYHWPQAEGVSPDGVLFTLAETASGVDQYQWGRHGPANWKDAPSLTFARSGWEDGPNYYDGGVFILARNTVKGGRMGVWNVFSGTNRLLSGDGESPLPTGPGFVCGALDDDRVAFVSVDANANRSLRLRPRGNSGDWRTVPKLAGAVAFNARGEAISHDGRFWQNGEWKPPISEGSTPPSGAMNLHDLNDHGVMLASAGSPADGEGSSGLQHGTEVGLVIPVEVAIDFNRDGKIGGVEDIRPTELSEQDAYRMGIDFRQTGAIVWANLDYDEENLADGRPVPDTIRFWHDGSTFEASNEDFVISNGERLLDPYLDGYTPPPPGEISSTCRDIALIKLARMPHLPGDCKVLLRVDRAEDVRAFHLYKRVPDFSAGDGEETAIWGAFAPQGAPPPPWDGADHLVDDTTIDLTNWVNENADGYLGYEATRKNAEDPFIFGIEAMLYKGMDYDFSNGVGGKVFGGKLDFTVIIRDSQGVEHQADEFRLTCLRLPAFPGAMGFGKWSQGGRGGNVYKVTTLADAGPGSLREGIEERSLLPASAFPGTERRKPLTIVFEVGGRIALDDILDIKTGSLTVAGQTAPAQGVTLTDATFRVSGSKTQSGKLINKPNDVILRYLRSRRATAPTPGRDHESSSPTDGYPMGADAFEVKSASRVIVDHCSFSGGIDGTMDISSTDQLLNEQPEMDVTAQWCYVHHALVDHSKASLILGKFGARYSILGCFYGHNEHRNPEVGWQVDAGGGDEKQLLVDFSDNVVYNWKDRFCGLTQERDPSVRSSLGLQFLSNYYKPGEDTEDPVTAFQIQSTGDVLHFDKNRMRGQHWATNYAFVGMGGANASARPFLTEFQSRGDALLARDHVRMHGGCSRERDPADLAYVNEIPPGTENPNFNVTSQIPAVLVSAYPSATMPAGYADTDSDGMADAWEQGFAGAAGIAPFLPWKDADGDGWTNLEEYLHKTNPVKGDDPMAEPVSTIVGPLF